MTAWFTWHSTEAGHGHSHPSPREAPLFEGVLEDDWHEPPRFSCFRTDDQLREFADRRFDIEDFHVVDLGDYPFQSLTLRP